MRSIQADNPYLLGYVYFHVYLKSALLHLCYLYYSGVMLCPIKLYHTLINFSSVLALI